MISPEFSLFISHYARVALAREAKAALKWAATASIDKQYYCNDLVRGWWVGVFALFGVFFGDGVGWSDSGPATAETMRRNEPRSHEAEAGNFGNSVMDGLILLELVDIEGGWRGLPTEAESGSVYTGLLART